MTFILIFKLFNRLPEELGFPACLCPLISSLFLFLLMTYPSLDSVPSFSSLSLQALNSLSTFPSLCFLHPGGLLLLVFRSTLHRTFLLFLQAPQQLDAFTFSGATEKCKLDIKKYFIVYIQNAKSQQSITQPSLTA